MKAEYKTAKESYEELLAEARTMTVRNIKVALNQRAAMHKWAVDAYEKALAEKQEELNRRAKAMGLPSAQ